MIRNQVLGTCTVLVMVLALESNAAVIDPCRSLENNEIAAELCGAQMDMDSAQNRLERLAEKLLPDGMDMQKRKNEFVRFGRSLDMDDGSGEESHDLAKRKNEFVRFGKRKNEFVRFGKRKNEFVRFGKKSLDSSDPMDKRKNEFVRFG